MNLFWSFVALISIVVLCADAIAFGIWTIFSGYGVVPSIFPGLAIICFATGVAGIIGHMITET